MAYPFERITRLNVTKRGALALMAGLVAPAIVLGSRPTRAQSRTFKLAHILGPNSQIAAGATAFAEELARRTNGRLVIEQFPNSTLGHDLELVKGVQLGTVDFAFMTGLGLPAILPEIGIFHIPFLFRDAAHAHAVFDSAIGRSYLELLRKKDVVPLAWGESGFRHITNSKREIKSPVDLQGLKLRVPQSDVILAGFKALGVEAAPLPLPQLYDALQYGKFDGQENPVATIVSAKLDKVQKYLALTGHVYDPAVIVMSPDAFDDLAGEDKKAVVDAAQVGARASREFAARAEVTGIASLKQAGMVVTSDVDHAKFAAAMSPALPELEKRFGTDAIARIRTLE